MLMSEQETTNSDQGTINRDQGPGTRDQGTTVSTDHRSPIPDPGFKTTDPRSPIPDPGFKTTDPRSPIPDPEVAIKVQNLTKIYKLYNSPQDRLKESLHPLRKKYHKDFYALRDVSFDIKKGETVGIIGKNGCGKSTLLKI